MLGWGRLRLGLPFVEAPLERFLKNVLYSILQEGEGCVKVTSTET